jgi:tripartite-type tricarboxylate transporter receptor subunit TctC
MSFVARLLLAAAIVASSGAAMAQAWPSKPIHMIVPFAPGAVADITARNFADELSKSLGQTVVVDNKSGAGGAIGTAEAAHSAPDGYTLLYASQGTMVFNIGLYARPGYDPVKDFEEIAVVSGASNTLVVPPDSPFHAVSDVIAAAKAKPNDLTFSSGGAGTTQHMNAVLFERATGAKMQHVPYRASTAALMAIGTGEVSLGFFNTPLVIGLVKSGKLRALAVTSATRSPLLPEVPTMMEQGVKDYVYTSWSGFAVPKGTPPEIVARLNAECIRITQLAPFREKMSAQGIDMLPPTTPAEASKILRDELALWLPIIKDAGASAEQ